jgi:uncharacterized membrane protein
MTSTMHPLAADYLTRLRTAAAHLPREQRDELVADIEAHLGESIPPGATEAEVRTALDRLGGPDEIVTSYATDDGVPTVPAGGTRERLAQMLLLFGGFLGALVGWVIGAIIDTSQGGHASSAVGTSVVICALLAWAAGVVLLWLSPVWSVGSKIAGTLLVPGGLGAAVLLLFIPVSAGVCTGSGTGTPVCTGGIDLWARLLLIALWVVLVVAPILMAIHLGRRAARPVPAA